MWISTYRCLVKVVEKLIFHMIEALNPNNVLVALFQCYNFEILAFFIFFLSLSHRYFLFFIIFIIVLFKAQNWFFIICGRHKTVEFEWKNRNVRDAWKISIYTVSKIWGVVYFFVFLYHNFGKISVYFLILSERVTNNREKQGLKNPIKRV